MSRCLKTFAADYVEKHKAVNALKKSYSPTMLADMAYLTKNNIEKVSYKQYRWEHVGTTEVGRWSYEGVLIANNANDDMPAWEIDGKTIKALARRGILISCELGQGRYGSYTTAYSVDLAEIREVLSILDIDYQEKSQ